MKKTLFIIPAMALVLALTSCASSSNAALEDLRSLSTQINTEGSSYGISDWKTVGDKYVNINKKIAYYTKENKYTQEQLTEIGELQGKCIKGFKEGATENISDKLQSAYGFIKGLINGLTE